ncbi:hypothetical protein WJX72_008482 [[Myrmecia] bisecta]|uniref:DUF7138 domain-containing protein n=1 Tax=[Myrmecia] bisecta TaxID=41462 RepID=A0AAW1R8M0_9CHLO
MASFSTLMRPPKAQEQLSFATPYPVFFSRDSKEKPQNAGSVGVNASMNFRRLQADLAAKLGLEGHQASQLQIVIVCSRASGNGEQVQQIPIHENTNFCVILNQHNPSRDKVVHFLVSIKDAAVDALRQRAAEASQHTKSTSSPAASDATLEAAKAQLLQQLAHAASMSKLNGVGARPVGQWGALPQGGNLAAQFTTPGWSQHRGMAGGAQQWQIGAVRGLQNQTGKGPTWQLKAAKDR